MTLTGAGGGQLRFTLASARLASLTGALRAGMTPVASYWSSDSLGWLEEGVCPRGACVRRGPSRACRES